ncbi:isoprenylcysteine carboxyl methyltransferase family protein [Lentibacillus sediminis]|uniref:isoprenylcysteine carboxyl methyltransferase family protein n=1 Tax=Lentibacillus sediminis TaxID=1940529 RepID=UPI000C1BC1DD|nr:isoprenylcysteine carboxylmethyltransferase family protein [Lentibacillus sediminis]
MPIALWVLLGLIVLQRLVELVIAKRNEKWMKNQGGIERGSGHYLLFIILHVSFFLSLLVEMLLNSPEITFHYVLFALFLITQAARIWCIQTLGRFWNTKIIIAPNFSLVKEGPYKYMKHPNYVIVGVELFIIPLLFGAPVTAIIFPILHILLLTVRIPAEEQALTEFAGSKKSGNL